MNLPPKISTALVAAFTSVLLAGCGSSDDDNGGNPMPPPAPPPPPPVAAVDPSVALVKQLVAQGGSDTAEPLALSNAAFASSDTAEPDAI